MVNSPFQPKGSSLVVVSTTQFEECDESSAFFPESSVETLLASTTAVASVGQPKAEISKGQDFFFSFSKNPYAQLYFLKFSPNCGQTKLSIRRSLNHPRSIFEFRWV